MADIYKMLSESQLVSLSENFDYVTATEDFVALKLFPLARTDNLKLAIANLVEGGKVPVMALVHALDTEARIGDRPNYEVVKTELFLIKEKLNQGEALKKLLTDVGMKPTENNILKAIFNDVNNLISRVLTRIEAMGMELLTTGKIVINENDFKATVDYNVPASNKLSFADWHKPEHSILTDIITAKRASKNKIKRLIVNDVVMGYILNNTEIKNICNSFTPVQFLTEEWAKTYIQNTFGIAVTVDSMTFKLNANDTTEYKFIPDNKISFVATDGIVGNTFTTSTPEEDYGIGTQTNGFVAITQYMTTDPAGMWTKASALAVPCPSDPALIYPCTLTKSNNQGTS